jgi:hypothetical protein
MTHVPVLVSTHWFGGSGTVWIAGEELLEMMT